MIKRLGPQRAERCINRGSYGRIYAAQCKWNEQGCVIKVFTKADNICAIQPLEVEILLQLQHKHLVNGVAIEWINNRQMPSFCTRIGVVMPRFEQRLNTHRRNPVLLHELLEDCRSGLLFLHSHNILHLDIKPQNILLRQSEQRLEASLADFGLSLLMPPGASAVFSTRLRVANGYRPPELVAQRNTDHLPIVGVQTIDPASRCKEGMGYVYSAATDWYALGLSFSEQLGKTPVSADIAQLMHEDPKVRGPLHQKRIFWEEVFTPRISLPELLVKPYRRLARRFPLTSCSVAAVHMVLLAKQSGNMQDSIHFNTTLWIALKYVTADELTPGFFPDPPSKLEKHEQELLVLWQGCIVPEISLLGHIQTFKDLEQVCNDVVQGKQCPVQPCVKRPFPLYGILLSDLVQ